MPINSDDVLRITIRQTIGSSDIQNVFHAFYVGTQIVNYPVFLSELAQYFGDAYSEVEALFPDSQSDGISDVFDLTADSPVGVFSLTGYAGGTGTGAVTAWQTAALVLFGTQTARSQGRKYLGVLNENVIANDSTIEPAPVLDLLDFAAYFTGGLFVTGGVLIFGNWNPTLARFSAWLTAAVSPIARTQRRRMPDVGS
jgi:hypothetical protein